MKLAQLRSLYKLIGRADAWQHGGRISRFEAEVFGD